MREFSKEEIFDYKAHKNFIFTDTNLTPHNIYDWLIDRSPTAENFRSKLKSKGFEYCSCKMYDIVIGDYQLGMKYTNKNEDGTEEHYYMFISANSGYAPPQSVAIGKAVNGQIYLIRENPNHHRNLAFRIIPEEYINRDEGGFRPKSYNNSLFIISNKEKVLSEFSDISLNCFNIAYQAIEVFSSLLPPPNDD